MPAAVDTAFDVAFWFMDTAESQNEYLQPQKLQRLLFLAQAYYAVAYKIKLMPGMFVADELGPIEPNIFAAFSRGRPKVDAELFLPLEVEQFLESIWRKFGGQPTERLTRLTKETIAYKQAFALGRRAEITLEAMRLGFARAAEAPAVDQVMKPKVMRAQDGRPVTVKAWNPAARPQGGSSEQ